MIIDAHLSYQVITGRILQGDERKQMSVATKVMTQIACKLGAEPWRVDVPNKVKCTHDRFIFQPLLIIFISIKAMDDCRLRHLSRRSSNNGSRRFRSLSQFQLYPLQFVGENPFGQ